MGQVARSPSQGEGGRWAPGLHTSGSPAPTPLLHPTSHTKHKFKKSFWPLKAMAMGREWPGLLHGAGPAQCLQTPEAFCLLSSGLVAGEGTVNGKVNCIHQRLWLHVSDLYGLCDVVRALTCLSFLVCTLEKPRAHDDGRAIGAEASHTVGSCLQGVTS